MARLVIKGDSAKFAQLGAKACVVGRLQSCGLTLDEAQSSRKHFEVEPKGSRFVVNDLGSRNGTLLNGRRVKGSAVLWHGDLIQVGTTIVQFESAPAPLPPGTRLGNCELTAAAGRSECGTIYAGRQGSLEREVIVEVVDPDLANDPEFRQVYQERARLAGSFDHPMIEAVFDTSSSEDRLYTVFESSSGPFLDKLIKQESLSRADKLKVLADLARTLGHIHGRGKHHGGLNPRVIRVDDEGQIKLMGLGEVARLRTHHPDARTLVRYMSPEEARGQEIGQPSDLYALGLIAVRLLCGKLPYDGKLREIKQLHASPDPFPVPDGLDLSVAGIVGELLEKTSADRPSADEAALKFKELHEAASSGRKPKAKKRRGVSDRKPAAKKKKKKASGRGASPPPVPAAPPRKAPSERKPPRKVSSERKPPRQAGAERIGSAKVAGHEEADGPAIVMLRLLLLGFGYLLIVIAATLGTKIAMRLLGV